MSPNIQMFRKSVKFIAENYRNRRNNRSLISMRIRSILKIQGHKKTITFIKRFEYFQ